MGVRVTGRHAAPVIPPITGGLHCGRDLPVGQALLAESSRPLRAGSIAAPCWPATRTSSSSSSRPLRAGSIAAAGPARGTAAAAGSSRPLRAGSIAASAARRGSHGRRPSSRPLRAGSIAAESPHTAAVSTRRVIPPITGGLHCGQCACAAPRLCRADVIPPITGGLHCGSFCLPSSGGSVQVIPPITGGLHCGRTGSAQTAGTVTVIPPITGGLHCGPVIPPCPACQICRHPAHYGRAPLRPFLPGAPRCGLAGSSRPLRAGSIAASRAPRPRRSDGKSSRPLRAGSIAAAGTATGTTMTAGSHPAHYGRAPLRPVVTVRVVPVPVVSSRPLRAGSIAASSGRPVRDRPTQSSRPLRAGSIAAWCYPDDPCTGCVVIPPITGGLHCGSDLPAARAGLRVRHPAHYGRAPLRPARRARSPARTGGHPAHYGRAPLRGVLCAADDDPGLARHPAHYGRAPLRLPSLLGAIRPMLPVIPPITGGLHCGHLLVSVVIRAARVIPPITGGLHCGGRDREGYDRDGWRHPAHYGRAPLRPGAEWVTSRQSDQSSRPLRAGSIAAAARTYRRDGAARVIPPITGGLHCGRDALARAPRNGARSSRPLRAGSIAAPGPATAGR